CPSSTSSCGSSTATGSPPTGARASVSPRASLARCMAITRPPGTTAP
ncbi:MAG: hypothetical protein AVDCRST_MAG33-1068, partial [uncultured Thermomicrobiales bacterium]